MERIFKHAFGFFVMSLVIHVFELRDSSLVINPFTYFHTPLANQSKSLTRSIFYDRVNRFFTKSNKTIRQAFIVATLFRLRQIWSN